MTDSMQRSPCDRQHGRERWVLGSSGAVLGQEMPPDLDSAAGHCLRHTVDLLGRQTYITNSHRLPFKHSIALSLSPLLSSSLFLSISLSLLLSPLVKNVHFGGGLEVNTAVRLMLLYYLHCSHSLLSHAMVDCNGKSKRPDRNRSNFSFHDKQS